MLFHGIKIQFYTIKLTRIIRKTLTQLLVWVTEMRKAKNKKFRERTISYTWETPLWVFLVITKITKR